MEPWLHAVYAQRERRAVTIVTLQTRASPPVRHPALSKGGDLRRGAPASGAFAAEGAQYACLHCQLEVSDSHKQSSSSRARVAPSRDFRLVSTTHFVTCHNPRHRRPHLLRTLWATPRHAAGAHLRKPHERNPPMRQYHTVNIVATQTCRLTNESYRNRIRRLTDKPYRMAFDDSRIDLTKKTSE
jgi:hypothetical protein